MIARALLAACCALALAACAGAAQPDPASAPKPLPKLRTGGPLPPERVEDLRCKVDADCTRKRACIDVTCRCVQDKCIQLAPALDPEIEPAPAPPASVR